MVNRNKLAGFWQSVSTRITAVVGLSGVVVFGLVVWLTLYQQQSENRQLAEQELRTLGLVSQATLNRIIRYGYPELVQEVIAELEVHRRVVRALIVNEQGAVIYSTAAGELQQSLSDLDLQVPAAFMSPAAKYPEVSYYPDFNRFYSKHPLAGEPDDTSDVRNWTLLVSYQFDGGIVNSIQQRQLTLLGELILVLLLASLLRVYLQRRLTRPLEHLKAGVEQLKYGNGKVSIRLHDNDELGQMARIIEGVAKDRAQYIQELKNLNTAIEQSNECVVITNIDSKIEYVNRAFTQVSGYSKAELIGQNPKMLQSGTTAPAVYKKLWETLTAGKTWRGELLNKRKDGTNYLVWATITPVVDHNNQLTHFIGVEEDITERKADEEKLQFLAYYEPLTALPNRFHLNELLQQTLQSHDGQHFGSLLLIDMDRLQHINDARGYEFGSELIKAFAKRLKKELKDREHTLAHLGADAFAVLLPEESLSIAGAKQKAEAIGNLLLGTTEAPFHIANEEVKISASIGCSIYPESQQQQHTSNTAERIIRSAETAMHKAKQQGGNSFSFYKSTFSQQVQQQFEIEKNLRQAIQNNELELYIQSQCLNNGTVISGEALVRWRHPQQGIVSPGKFIPVAEQSDLIVAVDRWVLTRVCELLAELQLRGRELSISVNISARHFRKSDFEDWIDALLYEHGVEPAMLVLEVTEGILIDDLADVVVKMERLSYKGLQFSIDDFGTGYSSLAYLSKLPVSELKIDQSFVRAIGDRKSGDGVIEAVVSFANHMDMRVVAEGVETKKQCDFLFSADADIVLQGYYFARPVAAATWQASLT
ncbi:EAL domain-containing protein [Idiomarina seosinensis]|uniref:EAL domain-containing protein n=1 Tax=Idiomarina seosinensis TaxID=281739 RepID=UPI00384CA692